MSEIYFYPVYFWPVEVVDVVDSNSCHCAVLADCFTFMKKRVVHYTYSQTSKWHGIMYIAMKSLVTYSFVVRVANHVKPLFLGRALT